MSEDKLRNIIRESLDDVLSESRMSTSAFEILSKIGKIDGMKLLDLKGLVDGQIGLFRYKDGNAYEIQITPAALIKDKELWGGRLASKENPDKAMYRDLGINKKNN